MRSLRHLFPVGPRISTLVRRAARRGGMGRDNLLASSADRRLARPYQDQRTCTQHEVIPGTICRVSGTRSEENEDPTSLNDLLGLWFFFSLPSVIDASPWSIKGKVGHPTKETDRLNTPRITSHIAEQRPSSQHPFDISIRDLRSIPLSSVCNPYYELFSANNMSSHKIDVGTFCLN